MEELSSVTENSKITVSVLNENKISTFIVDTEKYPYQKSWIGKTVGEIIMTSRGKECRIESIVENEITVQPKPPITGGILSDPFNPVEPFPKTPSFVIIKTSWDRRNLCRDYFKCSNDKALYHSTRHSWKVKYEHVILYDYVLSVIDKRVQEVYKVSRWRKVFKKDVWGIDDDKALGRFEFEGEVAPPEIRNLWLDAIIPQEYVVVQNPVVYSDLRSKN